MGKKTSKNRVRHNPKKKTIKKSRWTSRRHKDLDEIQAALSSDTSGLPPAFDADRAGGGQSYCAECDRDFIGVSALSAHTASKAHKRRSVTSSHTAAVESPLHVYQYETAN